MGFPNRILRSRLGVKLKDPRPVENPAIEAGSDRLNLLEHVAVGAGLIVPRVSLIAEWSSASSSFQIFHQAEAWNVDNAQAHPTLSRFSTGVYLYMFAATYLDSKGEAVPFTPSAARVTARGNCNAHWDFPVSGSGIAFAIKDDVDVFTDARFWLEVF